jgi:hypothetical protein
MFKNKCIVIGRGVILVICYIGAEQLVFLLFGNIIIKLLLKVGFGDDAIAKIINLNPGVARPFKLFS